MTPAAYRELLNELKLSPRAAARLLGVNRTTSLRWLSGERDIAAPAFRMLILLRDFKIAPGAAADHLERELAAYPASED